MHISLTGKQLAAALRPFLERHSARKLAAAPRLTGRTQLLAVSSCLRHLAMPLPLPPFAMLTPFRLAQQVTSL
jgi:hypothetical protein